MKISNIKTRSYVQGSDATITFNTEPFGIKCLSFKKNYINTLSPTLLNMFKYAELSYCEGKDNKKYLRIIIKSVQDELSLPIITIGNSKSINLDTTATKYLSRKKILISHLNQDLRELYHNQSTLVLTFAYKQGNVLYFDITTNAYNVFVTDPMKSVFEDLLNTNVFTKEQIKELKTKIIDNEF